MTITLLQTSDANNYIALLEVTRIQNEYYCLTQGIEYSVYVGVKRGYHDWQATFNRINLLDEMAADGRAGWVLYLDADAYVHDMDFDIKSYIMKHSDKLLIAAPGGGGGPWDINAGVFLLNLSHPLAGSLTREWRDVFEACVSEDMLKAAAEPWGREWCQGFNDQDILHSLLLGNRAYLVNTHIESRSVINSSGASFIRQVLRTHGAFDQRVMTAASDCSAAAEIMALRYPDNHAHRQHADALRSEKARIETLISNGMSLRNIITQVKIFKAMVSGVEEAIEAARTAIARWPKNSSFHARLGAKLFEHGEFAAAEASVRAAIQLDGMVPSFFELLSRIALKLGRFRDAVQAAEMAVKLNPGESRFRIQLSVSLSYAGDYQQAEQEIRKVIKGDSQNYWALLQEARIHVKQGRLLDAELSISRAVDQKIDLSVLLEREGDIELALLCARAAARAKPENAWCHHQVGRILGRMKEYEQAVDAVRTAMLYDPNNEDYALELAVFLEKLGSIEEAANSVKKILSRNGENAKAKNYWARLSQQLGEVSGAEALWGEKFLDYKTSGYEPSQLAEARKALQQVRHEETGCLSLDEIALRTGTDKSSRSHNYVEVYETLFRSIRLEKLSLLELGLQTGGPELGRGVDRKTTGIPSIDLWLEYFPNAHIYGFDISDFSQFNRDRFTFIPGNLSSREDVQRIAEIQKEYDIIIDDASHASYHQQLAFTTLFPLLKSGGYYIIEDLQWQPEIYENEYQNVWKTRDLFWYIRRNKVAPEDRNMFWSAVNDLLPEVASILIFQENYDKQARDKLLVMSKA